MPYGGKVTTGSEILKELYEISARYQQIGRLIRYDCEPADVYSSYEMFALVEAQMIKLDSATSSESAAPDQVRSALLDLAMVAVAWSREIRDKCP